VGAHVDLPRSVHARRIDRFQRSFDLNPGVAVQDVDPAERLERSVDELLEGLVVTDVGLDIQRPATGLGDCSRRWPSRSATTTAAPSRASIAAPARPMPEPAPVTIATRSLRIMAGICPPGRPDSSPVSMAQARRKVSASTLEAGEASV
jgi:hypothetical protein